MFLGVGIIPRSMTAGWQPLIDGCICSTFSSFLFAFTEHEMAKQQRTTIEAENSSSKDGQSAVISFDFLKTRGESQLENFFRLHVDLSLSCPHCVRWCGVHVGFFLFRVTRSWICWIWNWQRNRRTWLIKFTANQVLYRRAKQKVLYVLEAGKTGIRLRTNKNTIAAEQIVIGHNRIHHVFGSHGWAAFTATR